MSLKDIRPSSQWTVIGSGAALPPPVIPQRFLSGAITVPIAVAAGLVASGPTLSGAVSVPIATVAGTVIGGRALTGAVTAPIAVVDGDATVEDQEAFVITLSAFIDPSGENTTAMLTAPSGKTTGDFEAGRIQDDENPADSVDLGEDKYTEYEWCIEATDAAEDDADYEFRVTDNGTPLDSYL